MGHDFLTAFQRGLPHRGNQRTRAARAFYGLRHQPHRFLRSPFRRRMRVEHHRIARGDHADGIVDDRCRRIGGWRYGAYHAKGSVLDDRHAMVACFAIGIQILNARCHMRHQQVFLRLVAHIAEACFLVRQPCQIFRVKGGAFAHGSDQLTALFQRHLRQLRLRRHGVCYRLLCRITKPAAPDGSLAFYALARMPCQVANDFIGNLLNLLLC